MTPLKIIDGKLVIDEKVKPEPKKEEKKVEHQEMKVAPQEIKPEPEKKEPETVEGICCYCCGDKKIIFRKAYTISEEVSLCKSCWAAHMQKDPLFLTKEMVESWKKYSKEG